MIQKEMFEKSFQRPREYFLLSPDQQWFVDKNLDILDMSYIPTQEDLARVDAHYFRMVWGWSGKVASMDSVLNGVGQGWHELVFNLIIDLFKLGWDGTIFQIKEKFGGLRFYIGEASEQVHTRIMKAESDSMTICENCGEKGSTEDSTGWIKTLCPECRKLNDARRN